MSDIIWSMKPENDSLANILSHMRDYAGTVLEAKRINYTIDFPAVTDEINLPLYLKNNVYLIFKEAVNNLAKYSRCTSARIALKIQDRKMTMQIEDNGEGFQVAEISSSGNGLLNMKKRAEESGAQFSISSSIGKGTLIQFEKNI